MTTGNRMRPIDLTDTYLHLERGPGLNVLEIDEHSWPVVRAPEPVVMPAGTWHTMFVVESARVITITWGAGTRHRDR